MAFTRSGISAEQVIPAVPFEDVRAFEEDVLRLIHLVKVADHAFFHRIIFLHNQTACVLLGNAVIGHHTDHVLASIVVMEQRRIKAEAGQFRGFRPRAHDIGRGYDVVVCIIHIAVEGRNHRIYQIKRVLSCLQSIVMVRY